MNTPLSISIVAFTVAILCILRMIVIKSRKRRIIEAINSRNIISMTAFELSDEYEQNEVKANTKYKNKVIRIYGTIRTVHKTKFGVYSLILEASNKDRRVICACRDQDISYTPELGQSVTITGYCRGTIMKRPSMNHCIVQIDNQLYIGNSIRLQ